MVLTWTRGTDIVNDGYGGTGVCTHLHPSMAALLQWHVVMWVVHSDGVWVDGCASLLSPMLDHGSGCVNEMGPGWWRVCERMVAVTPTDEYR